MAKGSACGSAILDTFHTELRLVSSLGVKYLSPADSSKVESWGQARGFPDTLFYPEHENVLRSVKITEARFGVAIPSQIELGSSRADLLAMTANTHKR